MLSIFNNTKLDQKNPNIFKTTFEQVDRFQTTSLCLGATLVSGRFIPPSLLFSHKSFQENGEFLMMEGRGTQLF